MIRWHSTPVGLMALDEPGFVAGIIQSPADGTWGWWVALDRALVDTVAEGPADDLPDALRTASAALDAARQRWAA